ncbi:MAG: hypothetical protein KF819_17765 [Labilithrix sp.]|nr:hypothetical protein [Labilithrix sp.]
MNLPRFARLAAVFAVAVAVPLTAGAGVRKEGAWPASDKKVSFEFDGKPSDGLQKLASEAGWSLVVSKGIATGEHEVKIDVDDQPADAVLEALFADSNVVARRNGTLITVTPDTGATPPPASGDAVTPAVAPPSTPPSAPPVPTVRGEDRNVFGASLTVEKDEIVHTVTVTGGSVKVKGTVTGDLVVAGGSAKLEEGARVVGNATVFGGSLKVERGARVDGDVGIVGGSLKREEGAIIGGKIVDKAGPDKKKGRVNVSVRDGEVSTSVDDEPVKRRRSSEAVHSFGQSITRMALLFVLGCVLLALANNKMESLRVETAARPMKSFAMGILGLLGASVAFLALCVTIVGIPFAILALLAFVFAVYGSIAAVLTTFGAAVIGHKTTNPYLHLLFGCGVFLVATAIPYVGGFVTFVVLMIAVGALVSTRFGGLMARRRPKPDLV